MFTPHMRGWTPEESFGISIDSVYPAYAGMDLSGYDLVLHNWSDLKGWSITFRFLSDIVQLDASWRTDPEVRLGLLDLMKSVSKEWE